MKNIDLNNKFSVICRERGERTMTGWKLYTPAGILLVGRNVRSDVGLVVTPSIHSREAGAFESTGVDTDMKIVGMPEEEVYAILENIEKCL